MIKYYPIKIKILNLDHKVIIPYYYITLENISVAVAFRVTNAEEAELQALSSELSQYYHDMLTEPLNLTSLGL